MTAETTGCYVITRFNLPVKYGPGGEKLRGGNPCTDAAYLDKRFSLFETYTFPALKSQTWQAFTWLVLFYDKTPPRFLDRIEEYRAAFSNFMPVFLDEAQTDRLPELLNEMMDRRKCERYLTVRIDNDDAVSSDFLERILLFLGEKRTLKPEEGVISFPNGIQYFHKVGAACKYVDEKNHFLALISHSAEKTILNYSHVSAKEIFGERFFCLTDEKEPMWCEVLHDSNYGNLSCATCGGVARSKEIYERFGLKTPTPGRITRFMVKLPFRRIRDFLILIRRYHFPGKGMSGR